MPVGVKTCLFVNWRVSDIIAGPRRKYLPGGDGVGLNAIRAPAPLL